jgi:hypothetical protein
MKYSVEQKQFLINYYPFHSIPETTAAFNATFGTNLSEAAIKTHCNRALKLKHHNLYHFFSEEQIEWMKLNFPRDESRRETYERFVSVYGNYHSYESFVTICKKLKLRKPAYRKCYQKGNQTWSTGLTKEQHKSHFNDETFASMTKTSKTNFPNYKNAIKYNVPKTEVLSDLKNGEQIIIPYKIYKRMTWRKLIGKGELTKTQVLIELAREELKKI